MNSKQKGAREAEIWKAIPEYENLYEASNMGNIRSLKRETTGGRVLKPYISTHNGYCYVSLCKKNKSITKRVHKLIMLAFNPLYTVNDYNKHFTINHINGNKVDNRLENLEWISQSENQKHAYKLGLEKVTWNKPVIRVEDFKVYRSMAEAARDVNGHHSKIQMCCAGKRKKHKGYHWAYYEGGIAI